MGSSRTQAIRAAVWAVSRAHHHLTYLLPALFVWSIPCALCGVAYQSTWPCPSYGLFRPFHLEKFVRFLRFGKEFVDFALTCSCGFVGFFWHTCCVGLLLGERLLQWRLQRVCGHCYMRRRLSTHNSVRSRPGHVTLIVRRRSSLARRRYGIRPFVFSFSLCSKVVQKPSVCEHARCNSGLRRRW